MKIKWKLKLIQTFFGLKPEDRMRVHDQVFDLSFYSDGAFTWDSVYYGMPIHLRTYYINKASEFYKKKNKQLESINKKHRK